MNKVMVKTERTWEIEDAIRTIKRYHEIIEDKGLMKECEDYAAKEIEKLSSIAKKPSNGLTIQPIQEKIKKSSGLTIKK